MRDWEAVEYTQPSFPHQADWHSPFSLNKRLGPRGRAVRSFRLPAYTKALPLLVGVVAAVLMFVRLFVPHPVGMANNGDGARLMCQIGADADALPKATAKWYFVRLNYQALTPGTVCQNYPSTQTLVVRITSWIHQHVLGLPGVIDARELAVEYCVLVGIVLGVFAYLLRSLRPLPRAALLCGLFLVLSEAVFADYAASPFSTPIALDGILVVAVAGLAFVSDNRVRYRKAAYLAAWAGAILAVGALNETATLIIPLGLFLGTRRFEIKRLTWRFASRIVPALCVLSLALTAAWSLSNEVPIDKRVNFANEVTLSIMPLTNDPSAVATGLGLPASWGKYSGSSWWSKYSMANDPRYPEYQSKFTDGNLGHFLAEHPVLAARVFAGGAGPYLSFRETNLGTYPANAGYAPESQECRDCLLQDVSHSLEWTGFTGVALYWLACIAAAGYLWRTSRPGTRRRAVALTSATLIGCVLAQYVTAVYGEGVEVVKHLSIGLFAASLTPIWLGVGALTESRGRWSRSVKAESESELSAGDRRRSRSAPSRASA